jgi:DNA-binding NtrC family response regulator
VSNGERTSPPGNLRVLVVEDEPRMRDLLTRAISSWGFTTSAARSAEDAVRSMTETPGHIVLLDLNLPGMSGLECLERIRKLHPDIQAIILTGFGDLGAARKAIHLEVVEFLTKPCHLGELESALDRARRRIVELHPAPLPAPAAPPPQAPDASSPATLEEIERQHILAALARNNGNRRATAQELGMSLRTLYYRLSDYQRQGYDVD